MIDRRTLFRAGVAGSAVALSLPALRTDAQTRRKLTPFVDELPLPPSPKEFDRDRVNNKLPPEFDNFNQQDFYDFVGSASRFYKVVAEVRKVSFHRDLPDTEIWGYRDGHPSVKYWPYALGPTFREPMSNHNKKACVVVRHVNDLPGMLEHRGFGEPRLSVHLHGAHVPYRFDGFPAKITVDGKEFEPRYTRGQHYDYIYPLVDPNYPTAQDHGEHFERASTLWYHDHDLDFTGPNVYRGLAGFFLLHDNPIPAPETEDPFRKFILPNTLDTGDENQVADGDINPLRLPSGEHDIPLVLQEKTFGPNGELVFDQFNTDGFLGQDYLVNGKVQPYVKVKRRKYRFRVLNGSTARIYQLFLTDSTGRSYRMTQIATEGGLLRKPVKLRPSFLLGIAERVEVVIDFGATEFMHPGITELFLENRLIQTDGRGPEGTFEEPRLASPGTRILKFILGADDRHNDFSAVPDILRPFNPVCDADLAVARKRTRTFEFERGNGQWQINGRLAGDLHSPIATSVNSQPEVWRLVNKGGGWWHPIHVHHEFMRVLSRNGRRPFDGTQTDRGQSVEADGLARKDTILLGPNSEVEVYVRFADYPGPFVFHCHNLQHEDHAMMARFDVVDPPAGTPLFKTGCTPPTAGHH